ncbi:MFS transporter [Streptomyces antimicrobicus]|uniref:MFS transporter n=1 Tax=Streptomyces antimicrobicus TaxID=2883108 RepID=A0ABS8B1P4_9ACTN|nr:MFS transporter [Streptomyces antimicrobicus]MCB5178528.1 MFS transporter [Streptomyces antimicrobicus]
MSAPVLEPRAARPAAAPPPRPGSARPSRSGAAGAVEPGRPRRGPRRALALAVIASCNAMIQLDDAVVNIALPGMRADLGLTPVGSSWVLNAYLLAFGGLLLLGGRAGDVLGRRKVFLTGVALFTAGAAARAAAPGVEVLTAVRIVQGVGAALAAPSGLALLLSTFEEGAPRKRAIAVCTAVGAVSTAGGLLLAGTLSSLSGWRWELLLNVPLGVLVLALGPFVIAETRRNPGRFDLAGALLSALGATALVHGLARAAEEGAGDARALGSVACGVLLLALFAGVERRAAHPVVAPVLFRDRARVLSYAATLAVPGSVMGAYFFLNQYFQQQAGYGPLGAALALTPLAATMALTAGAAVRLERHLGPRHLMATGAALLLTGNLWLSRLPDAAPADAASAVPYWTGVLPPLLLLGAGMACCVIPPTVLATSGLRGGEAGAASSVLNAVQTLGGSLGLAVLVAVASRAGMTAGFTAGAACAGAALLAALLIGRRPGRTGEGGA